MSPLATINNKYEIVEKYVNFYGTLQLIINHNYYCEKKSISDPVTYDYVIRVLALWMLNSQTYIIRIF